MRKADQRVATLTLAKQMNAELVEFVIDDALLRSAAVQRLTHRVLRRQRALREVTDDDAWRAYLQLEEATNERTARQLRAIFHRMLEVYVSAIEARRVP